jgi:hypothetical protein
LRETAPLFADFAARADRVPAAAGRLAEGRCAARDLTVAPFFFFIDCPLL